MVLGGEKKNSSGRRVGGGAPGESRPAPWAAITGYGPNLHEPMSFAEYKCEVLLNGGISHELTLARSPTDGRPLGKYFAPTTHTYLAQGTPRSARWFPQDEA